MTENQNRTPAGVPTGGQFAASARSESDVSLASSQRTAMPPSADEEYDFYDALVMRKYFDNEAETALASWESASASIAWWRLGSKKKAAAARSAATLAVSKKTLNDSIIDSYTRRHGVPGWAERHMPKHITETPDTDLS